MQTVCKKICMDKQNSDYRLFWCGNAGYKAYLPVFDTKQLKHSVIVLFLETKKKNAEFINMLPLIDTLMISDSVQN